MTGLGIAALVVAVVLYLAGRTERWLTARAHERHALERERLQQERALKEREFALAEARRSPAPVEVPPPSEFPQHMLAFVGDESEEWAREDALKLIGEAYVEAGGDWRRAQAYLANRYAAQPASRLTKTLLA